MEILDLKNIMPEMKNSLEQLSSFEMPVKRVGEFKDRPIDVIESGKQKQ